MSGAAFGSALASRTVPRERGRRKAEFKVTPGFFVAATPASLPAGICGIIATIAWSRMLATRGGWFAGVAAFCGRYSMSIYVMHIFFTAGTRIVLKRLVVAGPTPAVTALELASAAAFGIAIPLAINWTVSKFNLDKWFGLQHMETA